MEKYRSGLGTCHVVLVSEAVDIMVRCEMPLANLAI